MVCSRLVCLFQGVSDSFSNVMAGLPKKGRVGPVLEDACKVVADISLTRSVQGEACDVEAEEDS